MKTTTFELELPRNMRPMARAAFKALDGDGCLFEHKGRLVMTDESGDLEEHGDGTPGNPWGCPPMGRGLLRGAGGLAGAVRRRLDCRRA